MKNHAYSFLQAAAIIMASWLLPTLGLASVLVDGVRYELDDAAKTAIVVPGSDKKLEHLTIPETITCEGVTYTVTAIADCAFLDFHELFTMDIQSTSLTRIGFSAFERCRALNKLTLPEGLVSIGYEAFKDCFCLEIIILPSTLKSIGDRSFYGCNSLVKINIPASVTYIGDQWIVKSFLKLLKVERKEPLPVKASTFEGFDKQECLLSVPKGSKDAYLAADVWNSFPNIQEGVIDLGQCGDNVFFTVTSEMAMRISGEGGIWPCIDGEYFYHITKHYQDILSVAIEEGVTNVSLAAFYEYKQLKSIVLPVSLDSIYDVAFGGCENLTSIYIPEGVSYIGHNNPFQGCYALSSLIVSEGNKTYDSRQNCNAIIETASNTLIVGCKNSIIPDDVDRIGIYSFIGCIGLTSINIPSSVSSIDDAAFWNCTNLTEVNIEEGVKTIGDGAFLYCTGLTTLTIPNSVELLDSESFRGCSSLASLTIGSGITHISGWAFAECTGLSSITVKTGTPPALGYYIGQEINYLIETVFEGVDKVNCILYVPQGSKEAYENALGWKDFLNIEEYDQGDTTAIETIRESSTALRQIFDLQGRRLNNASGHSIVIENGRKRIMR